MRLVALIVIWAVSWPAIKIGVTAMSPLWYAFWRYAIAGLCLCGVVAWRREAVLPSRGDWPLVLVSSVFQLAAFSALTGIALTVLPPGRASVLAYSTPLWVVPLAAWRLRERVSRWGVIGVGVGICGVVTIAAPSMRAAGGDQIYAYGLLVGAACAWAISIVFVRAHRFEASTLALAPWQMAVAAVLLLPLALIFEPTPTRAAAASMLSLAYVGPVATAFAYWSVVELGRRYRAGMISMALLCVPALGVVLSAAFIGENIDAALVAGVLLIAGGIRMASRPRT